VQLGQVEREWIGSSLEEKEDGGSLSGGGENLIILDSFAWLQVVISFGHLMIIIRII
jgi:hypothetical protein